MLNKRSLSLIIGLIVMPYAGISMHAALAQDEPDLGAQEEQGPSSVETFVEEQEAPEIKASPEQQAANEAALEMMAEVIDALDGEAERNGNNWQFTLDDQMLIVVTDSNASRMRIIAPIAESAMLPPEALERLLQANFDTALDARYAIGQGVVWGVFLHPLDTITTRDFASGVLQTKSIADTFGTTFSSGILNYGGGDSVGIIEQQVEDLLKELERRQTT